jgi:hypothetical protein
MMNQLFLLLLIAFVTSRTCAFVPTTPSFTRAVARRMVRFDGEKWIPETDDETPDAGYSIGGTLLRFGPIPAIKRVFQSDEYEQAVLKFMYSEGCDRNQAQGNMDYYMRNPNDWFAVRLKEEKSGVKKDFVSIDAVKTALTLVWGVIVLVIGAKLAFQIASGELDLVSSKTFNPPFSVLHRSKSEHAYFRRIFLACLSFIFCWGGRISGIFSQAKVIKCSSIVGMNIQLSVLIPRSSYLYRAAVGCLSRALLLTCAILRPFVWMQHSIVVAAKNTLGAPPV